MSAPWFARVLVVVAIVVGAVAITFITRAADVQRARDTVCRAMGEEWRDGRWVDHDSYMPGQCVMPAFRV